MPRLVNNEIAQILSDVAKSEEKASDALYNHFKSMTKIIGTDSFKGGGAEAYKTYIGDVNINYLNTFLNLIKEVTTSITEIQKTCMEFESSESGIVGSGTLENVQKELGTKKNEFVDLNSEIEQLNVKAAEHITLKQISSSDVESDFDNAVKITETISKGLSTTNSTALTTAESLYQRISEVKNAISKISNDYHANGRIDYDKVSQISKEGWYTVETPVALMEKTSNDPYGYEVFGDVGAESQWARGLSNDIYGSFYGKAVEYKLRVESGDNYLGGEAFFKGLSAGGYGQLTKYLKGDAEISALSANGKLRMGFNDDYKGASLAADAHFVKASGSFVLGSDNFNAYAKAEASLMSADGHADFEFEEDRFKIGLGGNVSMADVKASLGFSFLEYDNGKKDSEGNSKGNLFGIQAAPKLDAGVGAEASLSGEKAMSFGPVDVNAVTLELGGSLGLGLNIKVTLPIPTLNLGWGL
ncbi:hypothetical protein I6N95_18685 [Vagococcus sp. BWB3-3]|uniref:LXG domain-containing protein n=1 Tax=Vagococcus allomyrinae TaxID=2794353 RepID=A0A940SXA0_9ENTE|nr:T7SS effector LXG polymorphic toxin [Vagococcus allomyrinae]MBP1043046.1 hypothetical protein [Vagococcus allomyrinae]